MPTTGKEALVYEGLMARVEALGAALSLEVAFPEPHEVFKTPASGQYLVASILPNAPRWEGVASGVLDQGLLQITVVCPKNIGLVAPFQIVAAVKAFFAKGTPIPNGGVLIKVSGEPTHAAPLDDPVRVSVPVTIPWTA